MKSGRLASGISLNVLLLSLMTCFSVWGGGGRDERLYQEVADLRRIQETNARLLAETVQNISTIRQEIQELKGSLEEAQHFFEEESQKNQKLLQEADFRLTGMEEKLSLFESQLQDFLSRSGTPSPTTKPSVGAEEETLYKRALNEINLQNFRAAVQFFDQFLQKFPNSTMADNAQYWKGEALFALKDYPTAILEFQKVVKKYPKSNKVPGAILKQGYAFYETKSYLDAKAFLEKVVTDFPKSEEAIQARERIQKINQILAKLPPPTVPPRPVPR